MISNTQHTPANQLSMYPGFEYRSELEILGLPLVHITKGYDPLTGKQRVSKICFRRYRCWWYGGGCDRIRRSGDRCPVSRWNRPGRVSSSRWGGIFTDLRDWGAGIRTTCDQPFQGRPGNLRPPGTHLVRNSPDIVNE